MTTLSDTTNPDSAIVSTPEPDPGNRNERQLTTLANILKAGGDGLRLEILRVLRNGAFGVLELSGMFDMRQPGMSHHLKVLVKAGLAETQREGNQIFYRRPIINTRPAAGNAEKWLIQSMFKAIDTSPLSDEMQRKIDAIQNLRALQSRAFFNKNADKFVQQQELIAEYAYYARPCVNLLKTESFARPATALEIGPGQGQFLAKLSPLFDKVYALDNACSMLEQSKQFAAAHQLPNIEFVLGDSGVAVELGLKADAVIINMVLHHVANPSGLFQDSAKLLNSGGIVLITELTHHSQAWVQDKCGDIWLGFEPEQLEQWAANAGLAEKDSVFIGLRNGFQVQVRKFTSVAIQ
ncbi:MAG: ArsR family transcriptional regulator [Gammaproteobacteria bacterium]|nr:MAG: ArsR family transcriptional regulator [Gammaproteobacteria bacterium]